MIDDLERAIEAMIFASDEPLDARQVADAEVALVNGMCPAGRISFFGLSEMLVFIAILFVGFIYVWKKGALQWD